MGDVAEDLGGNVLVRAAGVAALSQALTFAVDTMRNSHATASPELLELERVARRALRAARSAADRERAEDLEVASAGYDASDVDWIGTRSAAEVIGCEQRHVSRIAELIPVRRGRDLFYDREAVQAYADARRMSAPDTSDMVSTGPVRRSTA